jgi:hypothetical protein
MGTLDTEDTWWAILIDTPTDLTDESVRQAVAKMIGSAYPIQLSCVDPWQARMLVADTYRSGRCFLAGDAAHQNPPWGGFGANTGIGDAADLGWKLAGVLQGWAGGDLLDSYEAERRPMALRAIDEATRNMGALPAELARPGIEDEGAEGAHARELAAETIRRTKTAEMYTLGFVLGATYRDSPIVAWEDTPSVEGPTSSYRPSGAPGSRLPHLWLDRDKSLYDALGPGFTLLEIAAPATPEWETEALRRGIPLTRFRLHRPDRIEYFGARYVLVRPVGQVAWRGDTAPDIGAVLELVRGRG